MSDTFNRRGALRTGFGLAMGSVLTSEAIGKGIQKATKSFNVAGDYACIIKSGNPYMDNSMLWSLLEVGDVDRVDAELNEIRERHLYKSQIRYSSNDRFKVGVCKEMISYLSKSDLIKFNVINFISSPELFRNISPTEFQVKIVSMFKDLRPSLGQVEEVFIKSESQFGPSREFVEAVKEATGYTLVPTHAKYDTKIQINSLIGGNLLSIIRKGDVASNIKKEVLGSFYEAYEIKERDLIRASFNFKNISGITVNLRRK